MKQTITEIFIEVEEIPAVSLIKSSQATRANRGKPEKTARLREVAVNLSAKSGGKITDANFIDDDIERSDADH